jgi:hypothetical protein
MPAATTSRRPRPWASCQAYPVNPVEPNTSAGGTPSTFEIVSSSSAAAETDHAAALQAVARRARGAHWAKPVAGSSRAVTRAPTTATADTSNARRKSGRPHAVSRPGSGRPGATGSGAPPPSSSASTRMSTAAAGAASSSRRPLAEMLRVGVSR